MNIYKFVVLLGVFGSWNLSAQTNLSFERWVNQSGIKQPENWSTMNVLARFGADSSCVPSSDAVHGYRSARLRSVEATIGDTTFVFPGTIQQLMFGSSRPKSLRFSYRATGTSGDSFYGTVAYYKGNIRSLNYVGLSSVTLPVRNQWTPVEVNINWMSNEAYDTAILAFMAPPALSAEMWVDNIELSGYGAGIRQADNMAAPLFVNHRLQVEASYRPAVKQVAIYSTNGQLLKQSASCDLDISDLPAGTYVLTLTGDSGKVIYSGQFLKQ